VDVNHFLDLLVATKEDAAAVVDVLRHDVHHTAHLAVNGLSASCENMSAKALSRCSTARSSVK
jgi:hypothetical protein